MLKQLNARVYYGAVMMSQVEGNHIPNSRSLAARLELHRE